MGILRHRIGRKRYAHSVTDGLRLGEVLSQEVIGSAGGIVLFEESFASGSLIGWFDDTTVPVIADPRPGSASPNSMIWTWTAGATSPTGVAAARRDITPTDSVQLSYWVKVSTNWVGSGSFDQPHMHHFLTTEDDHWAGLSQSHLTIYDELNWESTGLFGRMAMQDDLLIDPANATTDGSIDLTGVTELRSIAGANGRPETGMVWDVFQWLGAWWNYKILASPTAVIPAATKNQWHHIKSYWKMNTVLGGIGQPDGIMQYWVDDALILDRNDIYFRTGQDPTKQFNTYIFAPYMGDGSPVTQSMQIADIVVSTGPLASTGIITATAFDGVKLGSSVTGVGGTVEVGGNYPNEPAGYTRYWENDFDQVPHSPPGVYGAAAGTDWWDEEDTGGLTLVSEATPFGNNKAIEWEWPTPWPDGSAPVNWNVDTWTGSERREQYICQVLKIVGTDFENQGTGTKLGYFGYAEDQDGVFNQCIIMFFSQSGFQAVEGPTLNLGFIQQGVTTGERYIDANLNGGDPIFPIGGYVKLEFLMRMNDVGSANGELHLWVNETKYHEHTDIVYRNATHNKGFQGWKVDPVWGGNSGDNRTRTDYWRIAHLYGSGLPFIP